MTFARVASFVVPLALVACAEVAKLGAPSLGPSSVPEPAAAPAAEAAPSADGADAGPSAGELEYERREAEAMRQQRAREAEEERQRGEYLAGVAAYDAARAREAAEAKRAKDLAIEQECAPGVAERKAFRERLRVYESHQAVVQAWSNRNCKVVDTTRWVVAHGRTTSTVRRLGGDELACPAVPKQIRTYADEPNPLDSEPDDATKRRRRCEDFDAALERDEALRATCRLPTDAQVHYADARAVEAKCREVIRQRMTAPAEVSFHVPIGASGKVTSSGCASELAIAADEPGPSGAPARRTFLCTYDPRTGRADAVETK